MHEEHEEKPRHYLILPFKFFSNFMVKEQIFLTTDHTEYTEKVFLPRIYTDFYGYQQLRSVTIDS